MGPHLVKSVAVEDEAFMGAIDAYWESDQSKKIRKVLDAPGKDDDEYQLLLDDLIENGMNGSYAYDHHVDDDKSELVNLINDDGSYKIGIVVRSLILYYTLRDY